MTFSERAVRELVRGVFAFALAVAAAYLVYRVTGWTLVETGQRAIGN